MFCQSMPRKYTKRPIITLWNNTKIRKNEKGDASLEETAHKVAWAAVKEKYEKDEKTGKWKKK